FRKISCVCRKVVEHPVHPRASGSIGIIHDERHALRLCWRIIPFQLRGNVRAITGKFFRDAFSRGKSRAGNLKRHCSSFLLSKDLSERQKSETQKEARKGCRLSSH